MNGFEIASAVRRIEQSLVLSGQLITPLFIVAVGVEMVDAKAQCLALDIHVCCLYLFCVIFRAFSTIITTVSNFCGI